MSNAIFNYGLKTQPTATDVRSTVNGLLDETKTNKTSQPVPDVSRTTPTATDQVQLSSVSNKVMSQPDFDRKKVDAIKQAIKDGSYPINPRKIAQSFVSLESLISNN